MVNALFTLGWDYGKGLGMRLRHQSCEGVFVQIVAVLFQNRFKVFMRTAAGFIVMLMSMSLSMPVVAATFKDTQISQNPFSAQGIKGDFNGDGMPDEVWFSHETDTDRVKVNIRLNRLDGVENIQVTSLDANLTANVQSAPASAYQRDCGDFSSDCEQARLVTKTDALLLSLNEGITVLVYWNGQQFEQDFVASDELRLRRAVSTLSALETAKFTLEK
jgi:hypothetical protein